jgi:uncharacterized protein (TIGR00251 family)
MALNVKDDGKGGVLIAVKAVPGASRDEIVGLLGDRLKIRVSAPPEAGQANSAICALVARELGVRTQDVAVVRGDAKAEKTLRVSGVGWERVRAKWAE